MRYYSISFLLLIIFMSLYFTISCRAGNSATGKIEKDVIYGKAELLPVLCSYSFFHQLTFAFLIYLFQIFITFVMGGIFMNRVRKVPVWILFLLIFVIPGGVFMEQVNS